MSYVVVFEGTGGSNSNTEGVRTITSFKDQDDFQRFKETTKNQDKIIAEGITLEEAEDIVEQVGIKPYFDQAFNEANYGEEFDWNLYQMHLVNIQHIARYRLNRKQKQPSSDSHIPTAHIDSHINDQGGGSSYCSRCQTSVDLTAEYCPSCGSKFVPGGETTFNNGGSDF